MSSPNSTTWAAEFDNLKLNGLGDGLDPLLQLLDGLLRSLADLLLERSFRLVLQDLDAHAQVEQSGLVEAGNVM